METEDKNSEKYYKLLQIFSHGTLKTYKNNSSSLPDLTESMLKKLQLLSLVTLASNSKVSEFIFNAICSNMFYSLKKHLVLQSYFKISNFYLYLECVLCRLNIV